MYSIISGQIPWHAVPFHLHNTCTIHRPDDPLLLSLAEYNTRNKSVLPGRSDLTPKPFQHSAPAFRHSSINGMTRFIVLPCGLGLAKKTETFIYSPPVTESIRLCGTRTTVFAVSSPVISMELPSSRSTESHILRKSSTVSMTSNPNPSPR